MATLPVGVAASRVFPTCRVRGQLVDRCDRAVHPLRYCPAVLLLAILAFGLFAGAVAQLVLGTGVYSINWAEAIVAGLVGSFVGGLVVSLLAGDGLRLRPSGLIGSIVGAIVVSAAYRWYRGRRLA
jgi:uncharacterized membrane protein YeaQ/YmgE (transglycosylase-associated protein family)